MLFFCSNGRSHLFPYRGGLPHLAVNYTLGWLVDDRELASLDLDLPRCRPFSNLVVSGLETIGEFVALALIRRCIGVHRVEQLDALLIRHLVDTLGLWALLTQSYAHHVAIRAKDEVALGQFTARLVHFTGIDHF